MLERSHKVWNYCFIGICVEKHKKCGEFCLVFVPFCGGVSIHFWSVPKENDNFMQKEIDLHWKLKKVDEGGVGY